MVPLLCEYTYFSRREYVQASQALIQEQEPQCTCSGVLRGQQFNNKLAFEYEERRTLSVVPRFQYDIVCRDDVTEPTWYYNGTKVPNATNTAAYQISEAHQTKTLKFGSFSIDQAGDYTCSKPCGTCTINIVTGNPVLNLDIQSATEEFNSATNILLIYYLMGDPLPTSDNVTWSHNGAPLKFPNSLGVFSIDNLLLITPTFTSNHKQGRIQDSRRGGNTDRERRKFKN